MGSRDSAIPSRLLHSWKGLVTFCKRTEFRSVSPKSFACKITKAENFRARGAFLARNREHEVSLGKQLSLTGM
jgi:hypothetical protein